MANSTWHKFGNIYAMESPSVNTTFTIGNIVSDLTNSIFEKESHVRALYEVYIIDLEKPEVVEEWYVFADVNEKARLAGLALSVEAGSVKADDIDKYHVHAQKVCDLPETNSFGGR